MRDRIFREISEYLPEGAAELTHRSEILALLEQTEFAMRWHYQPGHLTASAFIVDPSSRRLLLHHHRRLGRWLQMGGHLEQGEAPERAALREGFEESGLADLRLLVDRIIDLDVHDIPATATEPAHRHFDLRYLVGTDSPWEITIDPGESHALGWFALGEAASLMAEPCSSRAVEKIRRILAQLWPDSPTV